MEVTWHEDAGIVVISLWQGERCRSTFQLPIEDAPALIAMLSSALGDAVSSARKGVSPRRIPARPEPGGSATLLRRLRGLLSGRRADVVPLRAVARTSTRDPSIR